MASTKRTGKKQKSLNIPFRSIFSLLFLTAGSIILVYSSLKDIDWIIEPTEQSINTTPEEQFQKPTKIYIPSMSQLLNVSDGYLQNDKWATSQTGVSFYTSSSLPGKGNTVIYGHNTKGILGGLWKVQEGDYIYVVTQDGNFVKYQVYQRKEIDPSEVSILDNSNESILTLYTCSGFLDTARFVVVAKQVTSII